MKRRDKAVLRFSKVFDSLDIDACMALCDFSGEKETKLVRVQCEYGIALTRLQHSVDTKLGKEASDAMTHAAGENTDADVEAADVSVGGNHAVLKFKGEGEFQLIRVNGVWKIASHELIAAMSADDLKTEMFIFAYARDVLPKVQKDFESGKLSTPAALCDAVKKVVQESTYDEQK